MVNLTIIRSLALVLAMSMLLFAEFLHPVSLNHGVCFWQEANQCCIDNTLCIEDDDPDFTYVVENTCPICSSNLLKYCVIDSAPAILYDYQDIAVLAPLPDFVFIEINLIDSPRAPPVLLS